jgi:AraC family transcriptional regulator, arabinose operon regulatory protein
MRALVLCIWNLVESPTVAAMAPPKESTNSVPTRFLQAHVAYRTMGQEALMMGCGFGISTGKGIEVERRSFLDYSGNIVLSGIGTYWDDRGGEFPLRPGTFFQRIPGREHTVHLVPGTPYAECWVHLCRPLFESLAVLGVLSAQPPVMDVGLDLALIANWNDEVDALRDAPEHTLARHVPILIGFAATARAHRSSSQDKIDPHARMVEDACQLLAKDHADRRPLSALASRYHLSYERFRKVFHERTGASPGDYRIRRRIDRARELLLADRDQPLKVIASALGYSNPFIFSAQFKQVVGVSPEAFRQER